MDFFARQDHARRRTGWLVILFGVAVLATISLVYVAVQAAWLYVVLDSETGNLSTFVWWRPQVFIIASLVTVIVVGLGTLVKVVELSSQGGVGVALMLGGREVLSNAESPFEIRYRNVVEEMSIASGTPVPRMFVMEDERGINAFAAGYRPSEAVVAVSKGSLEGLTRDELQGVVAHEFSHILNGDMALNLHLMGMLNGLMAISLTGRVLVDLVGDTRHSRRSSRSDKGDPRAAILLFGFALIAVGWIGQFFGRWIKAGISRSRERLADAAAVQFTRNPLGIANALKKVGRNDRGSRLRHPQTEQASHLLFAQGMKLSGFATHPPLKERIRWLDPSFDGTFPRASLEDLRREVSKAEAIPTPDPKPDVVDLLTDPTRLAVAGAILDQAARRPSAPAPAHTDARDLLEHVGAPQEQHAARARELLAAIPPAVREAIQEPHGARVVVYWMLLQPDPEARALQLDLLAQRLDPAVLAVLNRARPLLEVLGPELRLPVLDLTLPVLRTLSPAQYEAFRDTVDALIDLDGEITLVEFVYRTLLHHHLDPEFRAERRRIRVDYYAIRGLAKEASLLLSALAQRGHADGDAAKAAFDAAVGSLASTRATYAWVPRSEMSWEALEQALTRFRTGSYQVKRWLLGAALVCMTHDHDLTVSEVELFRVIAVLLDCPVPPWVSPGETHDPETT